MTQSGVTIRKTSRRNKNARAIGFFFPYSDLSKFQFIFFINSISLAELKYSLKIVIYDKIYHG